MRKSALWLSTTLACGLGPAACTNQDAQMQSEKMILTVGADRNWTVYGGDLANNALRCQRSDQRRQRQ